MQIIMRLVILKNKDLVRNVECLKRDGKGSLKITMVEL